MGCCCYLCGNLRSNILSNSYGGDISWCIWASSRCQWVSPQLSQPPRHCACALHPHLRPHVQELEGSNKDAQRRGSPEPRHRVKPTFIPTSEPEASQRTFNPPGSLVGARHGAEEIHLGHRASPPELRRRVGNSVDHGQRWGSRCWTGGLADGGAWSSERVKRWLTEVRRVLTSLLLKGRLINSATCTAWCLCVDMGPGTHQ